MKRNSKTRSAARPEGRRGRGAAVAACNFFVIFALFAVYCCGCTVIPKPVQADVASYDGAAQNSGLLSLTTNSTGEVTGAIITAHARDRYNALVAIYSTNFFPRLTPDAGITPLPVPQYAVAGKPPPLPAYQIDAEHLVDFMEMNRWHKQRPL